MPKPNRPEPPKRRAPNTGSVLVRKDGRVVVRLPADLDPTRAPIYGPGRRVPFAGVEQATAWLDAEIRRRRSPPAVASPDELLGSYLFRWYRMHEHDWPPKTASAYRLAIRRWHALRNVRLGALTREAVQVAVADLRTATWTYRDKHGAPTSDPRPYSRRTIAQALAVLHQALEDLIPDVLTYNPARARRARRPQQEPDQPVWTSEQAERFLAYAERLAPDLALGYRLILRRALRIGEVIALDWSDVDAGRQTLRIDETAVPNSQESGPTKTRRVRDVPLSADLTTRLRDHRRAYPSTLPFVFVRDGRRVSVDTFRNVWDRVAAAARLPKLAPKDGRATCATLLLDAGRPLPQVQQLLGHTSVATTAKFYARILRRRQDQVAGLGEALDEALAAPSEGENGPEGVSEGTF